MSNTASEPGAVERNTKLAEMPKGRLGGRTVQPWLRPSKLTLLLGAIGLMTCCAQAQDRGEGQTVFRDQGCFGCHTIGAMGTPIAPDLSHIGVKRDRAYLTRWLREPSMQRPTAHMPKIQLSESEVQALAAYLGSLR
jgi:mono/diheme cytochrome c family protein